MTSPLRQLIARGWARPLLDLARQSSGFYRVCFLGAASSSGILQRLGRSPATAEQLASELGYDPDRLDGLRAWLDLGVTLGELRRRGSAYSLRSSRARALVRPGNDPLAAIYEEYAQLEHRLVVETPARLRDARPFVLGDAAADLIARSSRIGEPWLQAAIAGVVPPAGPVRLLEIGCGSGAHIREAAAHNPELTAVGIELQEPAAEQARRNLAEWGLQPRVSVEVGDIRDREPSGDFDLATLHQNIYYFPDPDQTDVLRHIRGFLRPGGTLLVTSIVRDSGLAAAGLDLWGGMTAGAARLPVPDELAARLRAAGFADVEVRKLGSDGMYCAFVATA